MHAFGPSEENIRFLKWPFDLDAKLALLGVSDYQAKVLRGLLTFWSGKDAKGEENTSGHVWASGEMIARRIVADPSKVYAALRKLSQPQAGKDSKGPRSKDTPRRPALLEVVTKGTRKGDATLYSVAPLWEALSKVQGAGLFVDYDRITIKAPTELEQVA